MENNIFHPMGFTEWIHRTSDARMWEECSRRTFCRDYVIKIMEFLARLTTKNVGDLRRKSLLTRIIDPMEILHVIETIGFGMISKHSKSS
jgi:hypothetical protein